MRIKILYRNFIVLLGVDAFLVLLSLYIAHLVRFDFNMPPEHLRLFYWMIPLVLLIKLSCFYYFDLYRGMWC